MNVYLKNTIVLAADKVFSLITGFFISIYAARYFGANDFGEFSYATSLVGMFGFVFSLGFENSLVKEFTDSKNLENDDKIFTNAIFVKFIFSLVGLCLLSIYGLFFVNGVAGWIIIALSVSNFISFLNVIDFFFQAKNRFIPVVKCRILAKIVMLTLQWASIYLFSNIIIYAYSNLIYNIIYLILLIKTSDVKFNLCMLNRTMAFVLFKKSLPFTFASIAIPIFMQTDTVMIMNLLHDSHVVGVYGAIQRLFIPLSVVGSVVSISLFKMLNEAVVNNNYKNIISLHRYIFWGSFFFSGICSIYSNDIVRILFGNEYASGADVFSVYVWTIIFTLTGPLGTKLLICSENSDVELYKTVLAAMVNVILNYFFIQKFYIVGAAYASLISYLIANVIVFLFFKRTFFIVKIYMQSIIGIKLL